MNLDKLGEKGERLQTSTLFVAGLSKGVFDVFVREPINERRARRRVALGQTATRKTGEMTEETMGELVSVNFAGDKPEDRPPIAA